jgi:CBS domain-containing protein
MMFCKEITTKEFPALKPEDTGITATSLMEELKVKHLPVVRDGIYSFLISDKDIAAMDSPEGVLENMRYHAPSISEDATLLEALHIAGRDLLTILPVVAAGGEYAGVITLPALVEALAELSNAGSEGAVIAVESPQSDYSLSQIIRLIEDNKARALSFFSSCDRETGKQLILFKVNLEDALPVTRSLERFDFPVLYHKQKQMLPDDVMQARLNELLFYLNL